MVKNDVHAGYRDVNVDNCGTNIGFIQIKGETGIYHMVANV